VRFIKVRFVVRRFRLQVTSLIMNYCKYLMSKVERYYVHRWVHFLCQIFSLQQNICNNEITVILKVNGVTVLFFSTVMLSWACFVCHKLCPCLSVQIFLKPTI